MAVTPRRLVHRGRVEATGFVMPLPTNPRSARRVLDLVARGGIVRRFQDRLVVTLPIPIAVRAELTRGAPLVAQGDGVLATCPLDADETSVLRAEMGERPCVAVVQGGVLLGCALGNLEPCQVADWIDLRGYGAIDVAPLGEPPPPPTMSSEPVRDVRDVMPGAIPDALPERDAMLESLARRKDATEPSAGPGGAGVAPGGNDGRSAAASPTWWGRFGGWLAEKVLRSPAGAIFTRQQARYLARMLELFETGKLDEALRHAIPANAVKDLGPVRPALGAPSPRKNLEIGIHATRPTTRIGLGPESVEDLRQVYRDAARRLVDQGRIEQAAFVFFELLGDNEEGVALLERHGLARKAAEIAEARELDPGLVVRQWMIARDPRRAYLVALRTGAFADAISRLEKEHPDLARDLALRWAESAAASGNWALAVTAVWPYESERPRTREWLRYGAAARGRSGALMTTRLLATFPDEFESARREMLADLDDPHPDARRFRAELAACFARESTPEVAALARPLARAIVRDLHTQADAKGHLALRELLSGNAHRSLRADAPTFPTPTPATRSVGLRQKTPELTLRWDAGDVGAVGACDIALLPAGESLVALGELGVVLVGRGGKQRARFDVPAQHLVVADNGERAIALARRGRLWKLSRLDLRRRTATPWREVELDAWADTFDGALWFVAEPHRVLAIDTLDDGFSAIWHVPNTQPERIVRLLRQHEALRIAMIDPARPGELGVWRYELPRLTLRARTPVPCSVPSSEWTELVIGDDLVAIAHRIEDRGAIDVMSSSHQPVIGARPGRALEIATDALPLGLDRTWLLAVEPREQGLAALLVSHADRTVRAVLRLDGAQRLCARLARDRIALADDRGRVIVVSNESGEVLVDHRLRPSSA